MTTLVSFVHKDTLYMAADKQTSSSVKQRTTKLHKIRDMVVSGCGSVEVIRLCHRAIEEVEIRGTPSLDIREAISKKLRAYKYLDENEIVTKGFDTNMHVFVPDEGLITFFIGRERLGVMVDEMESFSGSGGNFAQVIYKLSSKKNPLKLLKTIYQHVNDIDLYTSKDFDYIKIKLK